MRYLRILNWAMLVAGTMMSLVLGVVTLLMAIYRERAAEVGGDFAAVAATAAVFAVFALAAALTVWSMHRGFAWRWVAQGGLVAVLVMLVQFLRRLV